MTVTVDERNRATLNEHHDDLVRVMPIAARGLRKNPRHRLLTEADLINEGWLWAYSHPGRIRSIFSGADDAEKKRLAFGQLFRDVQGVMRHASDEERASGNGYKADDLAFYGRGLVDKLLPSIWDDSYRISPPREGERSEGGGSSDPALSGDWQAACYDVQQAWQQAELEPHLRTALRSYGMGASKADVAREMSVAQSTAGDYIKKGLDVLVDVLNAGPRPRWWTEASRPPRAPERTEWSEQ